MAFFILKEVTTSGLISDYPLQQTHIQSKFIISSFPFDQRSKSSLNNASLRSFNSSVPLDPKINGGPNAITSTAPEYTFKRTSTCAAKLQPQTGAQLEF